MSNKMILLTNGYYIIPNFIPISLCDTLYKGKSKADYNPIFRKVFNEIMDKKRFQGKLEGSTLNRPVNFRLLEKAVQSHIRSVDSNWKIGEFFYLKSLPNGGIQDYHNDYLTNEVNSTYAQFNSKPAGMIIAIQDNTTLTLLKKGKNVIVSIPKGSALVFSGDLDHCGSNYKQMNYRIHVSILIKKFVFKGNATESARGKWYICKHCENHKSQNYNRHKAHQFRCTAQPKYAEFLLNIREKGIQKKKCTLCDMMYTRNYISKHKKRCKIAKSE